MFSRKVQYEATADASSLEDLSRKLAVDLRKHVRRLEAHPVHSKEWLGMIDSVLHISNIAMMEHRLPRDDDAATLWEGEELTVRFLLEEGKLNLCLRLMHEYKKAQRGMDAPAKDSAAQAAGVDSKTLDQRALVFEQSLSVLLKCAFEHVEPLQTIDMPELLEHCAEVMDSAAARPSADVEFNRTQESAVPLYLAAVAKRLEALDEARVAGLMRQCSLLQRMLAFAAAHLDALAPETVEAAAGFVNAVLESEDFSTHKKVYLPDGAQPLAPLPSSQTAGPAVDAKAALVSLKVAALKGTGDAEARRKLGALVREADAVERLARLKAGD